MDPLMTIWAQQKETIPRKIHILAHRLTIIPVMNVKFLTVPTLVFSLDEFLGKLFSAHLTAATGLYDGNTEVPPHLTAAEQFF